VKVRAYDPKASYNTKMMFPDLEIEYYNDPYSACERSDCIVLLTEWKELCSLDFVKLKSIVGIPTFIDLRNVYDPSFVRSAGFYYEGVGKK
jgi:UDPglucose 6-dehydrogenase